MRKYLRTAIVTAIAVILGIIFVTTVSDQGGSGLQSGVLTPPERTGGRIEPDPGAALPEAD